MEEGDDDKFLRLLHPKGRAKKNNPKSLEDYREFVAAPTPR